MSANWPDEPANFTDVRLNFDFTVSDTGDGNNGTVDTYAGTMILDADTSDPGPVSPTNVGIARLAANVTSGGFAALTNPANGNRVAEIFVGLAWKPVAGECADLFNSENKLIFVRNLPNNSLLCWKADGAGGVGNPKRLKWNLQGIETLNTHLGAEGGFYLPGNINNDVTACGIWHKIEIRVRKSTTSSSRDGIIQWWDNGVLHGRYDPALGNGVNWPDGIQEVIITQSWDGSWSQTHGQWTHEFDHWYVSVPGSDITPPAAPTGVTVS